MPKRQLTGKIVSDKMQKTVVVEVESVKEHPIYKKQYRMHKNYKAHVSEGEYKVGETVTIEECAPISKDKRWQVIEKAGEKAEETKEKEGK
ncbi:MAG: 30S ribosomal protein S17 [Candidatus Paceibacterota bacterium]|jgi:small subunit ribosomal protein S17